MALPASPLTKIVSARPSTKRLLSVLDLGVLAGLASVIFYTVSRHEPWADEAQAWLIARDMGWTRMVFSELRYEGHPLLWYTILWPLIHFFHMPYAAFGYLGAALGVGGIAVLIFLAPMPRFIRYLIAASFFFVYQYSVVARSYNLMPLLAFLAAHFYRRGDRRLLAFAISVALLLQVSVHAAFLGLCLSAFYAWRMRTKWKQMPPEERRHELATAAIISASFLLMVIVLYPPQDTVGVAEAASLPLQIHLQKMLFCLSDAFGDSIFVVAPFVLLAAFWAMEHRGLILMLASVLGTAAIYGFLRGAQHHIGLVLLAFVVSIWVVWPTAEDISKASIEAGSVHSVFVVSLSLILAWQCVWSYRAIRNDWAGPYSGAQATAAFLKSVDAERHGCSAFFYMEVGVAPYFDHNIFQNLGGPGAPSYFHHSLAYARRVINLVPENMRSRFVVLGVNYPIVEAGNLISIMHNSGYQVAFTADGSAFFKNKRGEDQVYLVFERMDTQ